MLFHRIGTSNIVIISEVYTYFSFRQQGFIDPIVLAARTLAMIYGRGPIIITGRGVAGA